MQFSIIIVSYNNKELIESCIESIKECNYKDCEVIVVDNNSDKTTKSFLNKVKDIILIENEYNYGFATANNIGVERSRGEWILLLNNDTVVKSNIFNEAERFILSHADIKIFGPKVLLYDGLPQPTCNHNINFKSILFPKNKLRKYFSLLTFGNDYEAKKKALVFYKDIFDFDKEQQVASISGVCMFIHREVIKEIGLFDNMYFMYLEDLDFCLRAHRYAYKIYYTPNIIITHYFKPISKKASISPYIYRKNMIYLANKNFTFIQYLIVWLMMNMRNGAYNVFVFFKYGTSVNDV